MTDDLISRQEAIDALGKPPEVYSWEDNLMREQWERDKAAIDATPLADVRPVVRGHWERTEGDSRFMCSVCKCKEHVPTIMGQPTVWDYCPHCGSWMEGGDAT